MFLKKSWFGWILLITISLSPIIPWLIVLQPVSLRFANLFMVLKSFSEVLGLVGVSMFSLSLFLSIRPKFLEDLFGGMNKVYVAHHILGGTALILLLFHPLASAGSQMVYSLKTGALYILPGSDWTLNMGIATLLFMMTLLIITFFISLPYQLWRFTHKFLGAAFFLAAIHGLYVASDIANYPLMKYYMVLFYILGLASYTYKTLLGRYLVKKYSYTISEVRELQDKVTEITLVPDKKKMNYRPGQFVFISFTGTGVTTEVHPFSISSTSTDPSIRFSIKSLGDFTSTLHTLKPGDKAFLEGSFGRFTYDRIKNTSQVWVAGGIGITPFLSMARGLAPEYIVDLYYTVRTEEEAVYANDLAQIAQTNKNFRFIPFYSKTMGRLSADGMAKITPDIIHKDIFVCGPPPMMKSLRAQLVALHIPNSNIHTEEFNLL